MTVSEVVATLTQYSVVECIQFALANCTAGRVAMEERNVFCNISLWGILVQFNPQTVHSCQYTWCIHGGVLCSPLSNTYLLCWITHLLEWRVSVDPV